MYLSLLKSKMGNSSFFPLKKGFIAKLQYKTVSLCCCWCGVDKRYAVVSLVG